MPGRRTLLVAGLLTLLATGAPRAATGAVRVLSPTEQEILIGATRFAFQVVDATAGIDRIDVYVAGRLVGSARPPQWAFTWTAPSDLGAAKASAAVFAGDRLVERLLLPTRRVRIGESVEVALVQLYPVVFDGRGRYVHGLEKDDFRVLDQGHPVMIERFDVGTTRSSVALVVDTSESMTEKLVVVQDACARFVKRLGERHDLSLYAFNQTLLPLVERASGAKPVLDALRTLRAGGGTALYDALLDVLQRQHPIDGRRVIVVFSDGKDERSVASREAAAAAARQSGVLIYTVGTVDAAGDARSRDDLRQLADATGAHAYFIRRASDLHGVFDEVVRDLEAQYVLSYPVPPGPAGARAVEVRVRDRRWRVRCRDQYFVEAAP